MQVIGFIIFFVGLVIYLLILRSNRDIKIKFLELDNELASLIAKQNFIKSESGTLQLENIESIKNTIEKIRINQEKWNSLFSKRYVQNSNKYTNTIYKDSRERHINNFLLEIENLVNKNNLSKKENFHIQKFNKQFNNQNIYMPTSIIDFFKIDTPIKTSEILQLDNQLYKLANKENYLEQIEGNFLVKDLELLRQNKEKLLINRNSWIENTYNKRDYATESASTRDYLFNRKFYIEKFLTDLEELERKELNPEESMSESSLKYTLNRIYVDQYNENQLKTTLNNLKDFY